jgi:hypothetical protein
MIGYIIPEIVIAVFSEGIGNAIKGAVKAVQIIVEAIKLTRVGKLIGTALLTVRKMFKVLESLFDGLKKMGRKGYEKIEEMFRKFLNGLKKFFGITDDLPVTVADDVPVTAGSDDLARQVGDEGGAVRTDNTTRKTKMDEASRKGDEIEAERPDYVTEPDPMTELDARKRGQQDLDKNDPNFEDKLEAYAQAVIITTAADKIDEPVSALLVTLNSVIGNRFKVNFKSLNVGPSTFDLLMNPIFYRNFTGLEFGESKGKNKEVEDQLKAEQRARDRRKDAVEIRNSLEIRGFKNAGEIVERLGNLRNRLKNYKHRDMIMDDVDVGLRGSSVTNVSTKTGGPFKYETDALGKMSDIDFFFSSKKLEEKLRKAGFDLKNPISPKKIREFDSSLADLLDDFANESRKQMGRQSNAYFLSQELLQSLKTGEFILK